MVIDSPGLNLYTFFTFYLILDKSTSLNFVFLHEQNGYENFLAAMRRCKARCLNNESCYLKTLIKTETILKGFILVKIFSFLLHFSYMYAFTSQLN